jgi:hypothetical protein
MARVDGALAAGRAVEEVAGVELHRALIGRQGHDAARARVGQPRDGAELVGLAVDQKGVVEARRVAAGLLQQRADPPRRREVERRPRHRAGLGGGRRHARRAVAGEERELVVRDRPGTRPAQVPVAVVRHRDQGGSIGRGAHLDPELVVVGELEAHRRRHRARVALVAVG